MILDAETQALGQLASILDQRTVDVLWEMVRSPDGGEPGSDRRARLLELHTLVERYVHARRRTRRAKRRAGEGASG